MILTVLMAATTLAITWIMTTIPALTAQGAPLGVRVPKSHLSDPVVVGAISGFKTRTWIVGITATVISLFYVNHSWVAALSSLLVVFGSTWAYLSQRRYIIAAKKEGGWFDGVETAVSARVTGRDADAVQDIDVPTPTFPWLTMLGSLLAIIAGALIVAANWSTIPDPVPVHWDGSMEPDSWSEKSIGSVFFLTFIALGVWLLFAAICWFIQYAAVRPRSERSIKARLRNQANLAASNEAMGILLLLMSLGLSFMQITGPLPGYQDLVGLSIITMLVMTIGGSIAIVAMILRAQSRLEDQLRGVKFPDDNKESPDNDEHYKWGILYYNPDDPAVLVEKRLGVGISFNYATWQAKVFLIVIALIIIGSIALPFILN
jgi:hypothetical protein